MNVTQKPATKQSKLLRLMPKGFTCKQCGSMIGHVVWSESDNAPVLVLKELVGMRMKSGTILCPLCHSRRAFESSWFSKEQLEADFKKVLACLKN